jgi:hypothetical protein
MAFCESWAYGVVPECWHPVLSDGMVCDKCWKKINENDLRHRSLSDLNAELDNVPKKEEGKRECPSNNSPQRFWARLAKRIP